MKNPPSGLTLPDAAKSKRIYIFISSCAQAFLKRRRKCAAPVFTQAFILTVFFTWQRPTSGSHDGCTQKTLSGGGESFKTFVVQFFIEQVIPVNSVAVIVIQIIFLAGDTVAKAIEPTVHEGPIGFSRRAASVALFIIWRSDENPFA